MYVVYCQRAFEGKDLEDCPVKLSLSAFENRDFSSLAFASWHTLITLELAKTRQAMWVLFGFVDMVLL